MTDIVSVEAITSQICFIRGQKVMLDRDLAELYGVETKRLKEKVRRNISRFPEDFMFVLTSQEVRNWRTQFATSNSIKMGLRHPPMAFTEQGVAMLSTVLNSKRAIRVNIQIMRIFSQFKQMLTGHRDLELKIEKMEEKYDKQLKIVFQAIKQLISEEEKPKQKIGF